MIEDRKSQVRERVWSSLEDIGAVEPGVRGWIPDFRGADAAAQRLAAQPEWQAARAVKCNPDRAQLAVRRLALREGKTLYIAVPNLSDERPFLRLDPATLGSNADSTAEVAEARKLGTAVYADEVEPLDVVVCGTVAVNREGVRIGKGAGYSDLEVALLTDVGAITPGTLVVTTVHPLQVVAESLPSTRHDFTVELIAAPDEVIRCSRRRIPTTVDFDALPEARIAAMPGLRARATH
ncbi:5-formyltetrahydrofolate cyclo-ligase [Cryptosporangium japonicum]|uniref:5-formyltetrahydrofolate cyclo-ligase n=1 Tax=Cryptosporangium japonicum TaxID=80872 RepID=A0ABP3EJA2_9ACTN